MAIGVSKYDLYKYVLQADLGIDPDLQTVFWMKPKTGREANEQTRHYMRAIKEKREGERDMDVSAANAADIVNFGLSVKKIENFAFPQEYYEEHSSLMEKIIKRSDGRLYMPVIDSDDMLADVCRCLDNESLREISEVSNSISRLKESQKK